MKEYEELNVKRVVSTETPQAPNISILEVENNLPQELPKQKKKIGKILFISTVLILTAAIITSVTYNFNQTEKIKNQKVFNSSILEENFKLEEKVTRLEAEISIYEYDIEEARKHTMPHTDENGNYIDGLLYDLFSKWDDELEQQDQERDKLRKEFEASRKAEK